MNVAAPAQPPAAREESSAPSLLIHASAHPLLEGKVQTTLERLLNLLTSKAHAQDIPVSKTEVRGFVDPEDDTDSVVVMQWVEVPPLRSQLETALIEPYLMS